ncbi:hypothetical protein FQA39_LY17681 [Lamprigera yunnana]|nr:hypothetical protein FQA39_LY17681 [Lamprigera yunnana]
MACRGFEIPESVTVESSFSSLDYAVPFAEDEKALNEIVAELSSILKAFSGDVSEGSFARASSLWAHAESRYKRMLLESHKEKVKRNRILLTLVELKSDFECKVKEFRRASLRAISSSPKLVASDDDVA